MLSTHTFWVSRSLVLIAVLLSVRLKSIPGGGAGRFLAVWSAFVTALYAFLGTELIGVTVGEAQNPRKTIPRAVKLTFTRIVLFYVIAVFLLGMLVPFNSPELLFANHAGLSGNTNAVASPFVVAIKLAQINILPGFLNGYILLFVLSASNSGKLLLDSTTLLCTGLELWDINYLWKNSL